MKGRIDKRKERNKKREERSPKRGRKIKEKRANGED